MLLFICIYAFTCTLSCAEFLIFTHQNSIHCNMRPNIAFEEHFLGDMWASWHQKYGMRWLGPLICFMSIVILYFFEFSN